jgi:hypothetical protein
MKTYELSVPSKAALLSVRDDEDDAVVPLGVHNYSPNRSSLSSSS